MHRMLWLVPLVLLSLSFLGAECSAADRKFFIDFAKEWAEEKGVLDKDGNLTLDAIARVGLGVSTGNPNTDAAIDAGVVAKNIKEADDAADKGWGELSEGHEIAAEKNLDVAVRLRPRDWSYRNQRAAIEINLAGSHAQTAPNDLKEAESLACGDPAKPKPNTYTCRQMYEDRARMFGEVALYQPPGEKPFCRVYEEQADAYTSLMRLAATDQERALYRERRDDAQENVNPNRCYTK
ncbi:MAG: hypothetical protein HY685_04635 [Chloroflexi bacterium]|nr:hypothetical protein [Chloroflexota bacterium]